MCCSVLQCVAVCSSLLQFVAVCCSVLQCVAVCCSVLQCDMNHLNTRDFAFIGGKITLQCVLQCAAVRYNLLQCVAVCCSFLQCVVPLKSMGSKHTYLVHMCDMTCSCV